MKAEHIKEFLARPREAVEASKGEWWASRGATSGKGSALDVGHALLEHARRVDPFFPSAEYLAADLEHHVSLKECLDRASKALARR
ncbi:MAG TPA: hypothetical protein VI197_33570 [Polyangiaceae bacterium]